MTKIKLKAILGIAGCAFLSWGSAQTSPQVPVDTPQVNNYWEYQRLRWQEIQNEPEFDPNNITGTHKEFLREDNILFPRLFPHGDPNYANKRVLDYVNEFNEKASNCVYEADWQPDKSGLPDNVSSITSVGRIMRIEFDPNYGIGTNKTMYCCSHYGGAYKSIDGGENWFNFYTDQLPTTSVADIVVNPFDASDVIIAGGNGDFGSGFGVQNNYFLAAPYPFTGLYRLNDAGDGWNSINGDIEGLLEDGDVIRRMFFHPTEENFLYLATSKGVIYTENIDSDTPMWVLLDDGIPIEPSTSFDTKYVRFKPNDHNVLYTCTDNEVYKRINNSWERLSGPMKGVDLMSNTPFAGLGQAGEYKVSNIGIDVSDQAPEDVFAYVLTSGGRKRHVLRYVGAEDKWKYLGYTVVDHQGYFNCIRVSDVPGPIKVIVGNGAVFGTADVDNYNTSFDFNVAFPTMGSYWQTGRHPDCHEIEFEPNTNDGTIYTGDHGGVSVKDITNYPGDGGWSRKCDGINVKLCWGTDVTTNENRTVAALNDAAFIHYNSSLGTYTSWGGSDGMAMQILNENKIDGSIDVLQKKLPGNSNINPGRLAFSRIAANGSTMISDANQTSKLPNSRLFNPSYRNRVPFNFKVVRHPKTNVAIIGLSDLFEILADDPTTVGTSAELFEGRSTLGNIPAHDWVDFRNVIDIDFNSNGDTVYLVTRGRHFYQEVGGFSGSDPSSYNSGIVKSTTGLSDDGSFDQKFFPLTQNLEPSEFQIPGWDQTAYPMVTGLEMDPNNAQRVWISISGYEQGKNVYSSEDGGVTWVNADPNGTLFDLPVNDILYQPGSKDRIFIATDAGVFFKDEGTDDWCRFGQMPNVRCVDLVINPCENTLTVGTFGRGIWKTDLPQAYGGLEVYKEITEDATLTGELFETTSIKIKAGVNVTLQGTMYMPAHGKIIIEQGARLHVQGGTITNRCDDMWWGIEVWGTTGENQFTAGAQGELLMSQDATLEHAFNGATNWHRNKYAETGGIIRAYNSNFINCRRSVEFRAYRNTHHLTGLTVNDKSRFESCKFKWDNQYRWEDNTVKHHITMNQVRGVLVSDCEFKDSRSNVTLATMGCGIYTLDAGYNVNNSRFYLLKRGVKSGNGCMEHPVKVNNSTFNQNTVGIEMNSVNGVIATNNYFNISDVPTGVGDGGHIGIWMESSHGFRIEDNEVFNTNSNTSTAYVIQDAGPNQIQVYNNEASNCFVGEYSLDENRDGLSIDIDKPGLEFNCNDNFNNRYDLAMRSTDVVNVNSGSRTRQGDLGRSASNLFTVTPQTEGHVFTGPELTSQSYKYYWNNSVNMIPTEVSNNVSVDLSTEAPGQSCDSRINTYPVGVGISLQPNKLKNLKKKFMKERQRYLDATHQLELIRDGGDKEERLLDIDNAQSGNGVLLYEDLDQYSPYLSEEVIKKASNCTQVLDYNLVFTLCTNNPEVTKRNEFHQFLRTKNNPFSEEQIENLRLITKSLKTQRGNKENKISKYRRNMALYGNEIILHYKHDTTIVDVDSVKRYVTLLGEPLYRLENIALMSSEGDYVAAEAIKTSTQQYLVNSESPYKEMYEPCLNFYSVILPHMSTENTIYNMNESTIGHLRVIAEGRKTPACYRSRNILNWLADDELYKSRFILPSTNKSLVNHFNSDVEENMAQFSLKPNPAQNWVEVSDVFDRENQEGVKTLRLISADGKQVQEVTWENNQPSKIINTSSLENGVYFIVLISNGKPLQTEKLVIKK